MLTMFLEWSSKFIELDMCGRHLFAQTVHATYPVPDALNPYILPAPRHIVLHLVTYTNVHRFVAIA